MEEPSAHICFPGETAMLKTLLIPSYAHMLRALSDWLGKADEAAAEPAALSTAGTV
jgi:hypothetical protein